MTTVQCRTLHNHSKEVPIESLVLRPSVYAIIVEGDTVLLARSSATGKYVLPGGGVDKGERLIAALHREVMEETGIEVEVGGLLHAEDDFFYYDPLDIAIHGLLFFYEAKASATELPVIAYPPGEDLDVAIWVDSRTLTEANFQTHGIVTMDLIQQVIAHAGAAY